MARCTPTSSSETLKICRKVLDFLKGNLDFKPFIDGTASDNIIDYLYNNYGSELSTDELKHISNTIALAQSGYRNELIDSLSDPNTVEENIKDFEKEGYSPEILNHYIDNDFVMPFPTIKISSVKKLLEEKRKSIESISFVDSPKETQSTIPDIVNNTAPSISTNINKFSGLKTIEDVNNNIFKSAIIAKKIFEKYMFGNLIRNALFTIDKYENYDNISDKTETRTSTSYNDSREKIDKSIKGFKSNIFRNLTEFLKSSGIGNKYLSNIDKISSELYMPDGSINPEFRNILSILSSYYTDEVKITNSMLNNWAISKKSIDELLRFNSFITLSNFDNLIKIYGRGIFDVNSIYLSPDKETINDIKYFTKNDNNLKENWNPNEQSPISSSQTALYKLLVENIPIISKNGVISYTKELPVNTINYVVAKLLNDSRTSDLLPTFDKSDPLNSIRRLFEHVVTSEISGNYNSLPNDYNETHFYVIRSLYNYFFKDSSKIDVITDPTIRNSFNEVGPSLYDVSISSGNKIRSGMDYLSTVINNFNLVYLNNYSEYIYDKDLKSINISRPDAKISESQSATLKNNLKNKSNTISWETKNTIFKDIVNIGEEGLNSGKINFNFSNTPARTNVTVDLSTGKVEFTDNRGKKLDYDKKGFNFDKRKIFNEQVLPVIQDITGIMVDTRPDMLASVIAEIDGNSNKGEYLNHLFRIAGATAYVQELTSNEEFKKSTIDSNIIDNYINRNASYLRKVSFENPKIIDYKLKLVNVNGLGKGVNDSIERIAKSLSTVYGDFAKAVIKNSAGVTMPLHGSVRHIYNSKDFIDYLRNKKAVNSGEHPIGENLFLNNTSLLKGIAIRTHVKYFDSVKHSSDMNPNEIFHTQILYDFYGSMIESSKAGSNKVETLIQPSVFADKNTHNSLIVDLSKPISIRYFGPAGIVAPKKSFRINEATDDELKRLHFYTQRSYYNTLSNLLLQSHGNTINFITGSRTKEGWISYINNSNVDPKVKTNSIDIINKNGVNSLKSISSMMGVVGEENFRNAFNNANPKNIPLIEDLGITSYKILGKKYIGLSKSLINMIDVFSGEITKKGTTEKYEKRMGDLLNQFTNNIESFGTRIEYKDENGKVLPLLSAIENKTNLKLNDWVDGKTGYLLTYKTRQDGTREVNPFFSKFFWSHNLISDNFNQLNVGTIFNHPAKGTFSEESLVNEEKFIKEEEAFKTSAFFKRQLQGTPMTTPMQGLINGIPSHTKTSFVNDIEKNVYNMFGGEDKFKTTDGSTFSSMLHIIRLNNSLLDKRAGVHLKTLGLYVDDHFNSYGLMKHAEFGITNERIRMNKGSDLDFMEFYKKSYGLPLSFNLNNRIYIPDLSTDFNGNHIKIEDISPDGLYYLNENKNIIKILDIRREIEGIPGNNGKYLLSTENLTNNQVESKPILVKTLFDLWKALGGENSVSLSSNGKFKTPNNDSFIYSDASHYALSEYVSRVGSWKSDSEIKKLELSSYLPDISINNHISEVVDMNSLVNKLIKDKKLQKICD